MQRKSDPTRSTDLTHRHQGSEEEIAGVEDWVGRGEGDGEGGERTSALCRKGWLDDKVESWDVPG